MKHAGGMARLAWCALAAMLLAFAGCKEAPTQIVVNVDSNDLAGGMELVEVRVTARWRGVSGDAGLLGPTRVFDLNDGGYELPGRIVVTPPDPAESRPVILRVTATVVERSVRYSVEQVFVSRFAQGRTKEVLFVLSRRCREGTPAATCGDTRTCVPTPTGTGCADIEQPVERDYMNARRSDVLPMWPGAEPADAGIDAPDSSDRGTPPDSVGDDAPTDATDGGVPTDSDAAPAEDGPAIVCDAAAARDGGTFRNCEEIRCRVPGARSGLYTVDPDGDRGGPCGDGGVGADADAGDGGVCPFQVYCDMDRDEGGWTLIGHGNWNSGEVRQEVVYGPDAGAALLSEDRLRALLESSYTPDLKALFRLGSGPHRLFVRERYAVAGERPGPSRMRSLGYPHWATSADQVDCGSSYAQFADERLASAGLTACAEPAPGFRTISGGTGGCGSGASAWVLLYDERGRLRPLPGAGGGGPPHPCAFYEAMHADHLPDLWLRSALPVTENACAVSCARPSPCGGVDCPCLGGQLRCGSACVSVAADAANCGACGRSCAAGASCVDGSCVSTPSSQRSCDLTPRPPGCGTVTLSPDTAFTIGVPDALSCATAPAAANCAWEASPTLARAPLPSFRLDAREVTVGRFRAFWTERMRAADGGAPGAALRARPVQYPGGSLPWPGDVRFAAHEPRQGPRCNWTPTVASPSREAHPINCVDWWTAMEFCVWDGGGDPSSPTTGRLPTEFEWEFAARASVATGLEPGRAYPWGNQPLDPTCDRARWNGAACLGEDDARTRRVGSFPPTGGFFDLAGNVAEWTADQFYPPANPGLSTRDDCTAPWPGRMLCYASGGHGTNRVVRGGSWRDTDAALLRSASRSHADPLVTLSTLGFRCARSAVAPDGGM